MSEQTKAYVAKRHLEDRLQRLDVIAARILDADFDKECIETAHEAGLGQYAKPLYEPH